MSKILSVFVWFKCKNGLKNSFACFSCETITLRQAQGP